MKKETPKVVEEMWKEQVESREEEAEKEYAARCVHEVLDVLGDYYKDSTRCSELIEIVRMFIRWVNVEGSLHE